MLHVFTDYCYETYHILVVEFYFSGHMTPRECCSFLKKTLWNVDLFLPRIRSVGSVQYDIVPAWETAFRLELRT